LGEIAQTNLGLVTQRLYERRQPLEMIAVSLRLSVKNKTIRALERYATK